MSQEKQKTMPSSSSSSSSSSCPKCIVLFSRTFGLKFHFFLALKDGKSGRTLINNREMKGNVFDTER